MIRLKRAAKDWKGENNDESSSMESHSRWRIRDTSGNRGWWLWGGDMN